ncbi:MULTISPECIES: ABC transporter permease [Exiguobacterium]|uniref:ABC transporter permease n=1 Tax=Exiguobacterium TaxID=33986 RepID=UPI001BE96CEA|nr:MULTISPECIES: ABC transporter permease [Exiguobacterium]MCT4777052.1 ABC transporter permease [Exiguobacterium aquaticum]MCT4789468.1 ABC transporter permease [Exiguobacterium mexicanum]
MIRENIRMAWLTVISHKMRSFLTILGIVIGTASIIALMTIISGVTDSINEEVATFGADRMTVQIEDVSKNGVSVAELDRLEAIDGVSSVSPTTTQQTDVYVTGQTSTQSVIGKSNSYFDDSTVATGRGLTPVDVSQQTHVALLGDTLAKESFPTTSPLGETIVIGGIRYTVVGTLAPSSEFSMSTDDAVIIPVTTALQQFHQNTIASFDIYTDTGQSETVNEAVTQQLTTAFNGRDTFTVTSFEDALASIDQINALLSMLLVGIASISLLVGGIGIMNMMLVSVTERTSEIGLRKALGATPGKIRQQFLFESVLLSLLGGFVGVVVGGLLAFGLTLVMGVPFTLASSTIGLALGFSILIGVVFGYIPARKASNLQPIEALRNA